MSTADLLGRDRASREVPTPAPDYHALGTFAETWVFLELFLDRCGGAIGSSAPGQAPPDLAARLDALDAAARLAPGLTILSGEVLMLTAEVRALAAKRQVVLQDLARASLNRLGMNLFAIPAAAMGKNAVPSPFGREESIDALHLKTCDLVRRTLLLLSALENRAQD